MDFAQIYNLNQTVPSRDLLRGYWIKESDPEHIICSYWDNDYDYDYDYDNDNDNDNGER